MIKKKKITMIFKNKKKSFHFLLRGGVKNMLSLFIFKAFKITKKNYYFMLHINIIQILFSNK
jgi:hypothetical protein